MPLVERRLDLLDRERGEDRVGQAEPQHDAERPEREAQRSIVCATITNCDAEDAGGGDGGEEAGAALMIDQVGEEQPRITDARERSAPTARRTRRR